MGGRRTANPSRKTTLRSGRKAPSAVPQPRRAGGREAASRRPHDRRIDGYGTRRRLRLGRLGARGFLGLAFQPGSQIKPLARAFFQSGRPDLNRGPLVPQIDT
jgi:hypothetical protein